MNRAERMRGAVLLGLALTFVPLLGQATCRELRRSPNGSRAAVYDPASYYQVVNEEVVDHLLFCPLYADLSRQRRGEQALSLAAAEQLGLREDEGEDRVGDEQIPTECVECDAEGRRLNSLFCFSSEAAQTPGLTDRITRFAELSPLLADLAVPDRWQLGAEGKVLGLRAGVHRQRLPERDPEQTEALEYQGELLYRTSDSQKVLIDGAGNERVLGDGDEPVDLGRWRDEQQQTLDDGRLQRTSHAMPLALAAAATLQELPDTSERLALVVNERSGLRVLVDGAPVDPSVRSVLAVDRGQVVEVEFDGGEALQLRLAGERTGTLSARRLTAEGRRRETDPESGLEDLVTSLLSALDASLRQLDDTWNERGVRSDEHDPRRLANADLFLSIERGLQLQTLRGLHEFAESNKADHNASARRPRYHDGLWLDGDEPVPFPQMTLTVLDADNGELLAMAAYPRVETIRAALERTASVRGGRVRLLREQLQQELGRTSLHLRPHPIGSLFKPFIAWSAGVADPQLIEFEQRRASRKADWQANLSDNRELTRCMVSGRRVGAGAESHLKRAYTPRAPAWRCDRDASNPRGSEDLCGALAVSDTYYFLELIARIATVSRGGQLAVGDDQTRDASYALTSLCDPQLVFRDKSPRTRTCTGGDELPGAHISALLPDVCAPDDGRAICELVDLLDVQLQETNQTNDPLAETVDAYLGPLAALIDELSADQPEGCASGSRVLLDSFRWTLPGSPQWSSDLMRSCTPDLEAFMEGGGLNYWNDIHIVQTLGRVFTGAPQLLAKLVVGVELEDGEVFSPTTTLGARTCVDPTAQSDPRCKVLHGLRGAIEFKGGTLHKLARVEGALRDKLPEASGLSLVLRGKTGTTRAPFPTFDYSEERGWIHAMTLRKSIHTALLVEVAEAGGRARHYVVYLSMNGVDDGLVSSEAADFFLVGQPGFDLLERLLAEASADLPDSPPPALAEPDSPDSPEGAKP